MLASKNAPIKRKIVSRETIKIAKSFAFNKFLAGNCCFLCKKVLFGRLCVFCSSFLHFYHYPRLLIHLLLAFSDFRAQPFFFFPVCLKKFSAKCFALIYGVFYTFLNFRVSLFVVLFLFFGIYFAAETLFAGCYFKNSQKQLCFAVFFSYS